MNCSICSGKLAVLGSVPFDTNSAKIPATSTTLVEYYRCTSCDFICCPEMLRWSEEDFSREVYNQDYIKYDPEYSGTRSKNYARFLLSTVHPLKHRNFRHLDYGSGTGVLKQELTQYGWNCESYDPYSSPIRPTGKFGLITAVEVFEHSKDIDSTVKDIKSLLERNGVVLFTTLLANSSTGIDWWYIGPRNGHISILSEKSMKIIAKNNNLFFKSIDHNTHILQSSRNNIKDILGW